MNGVRDRGLRSCLRWSTKRSSSETEHVVMFGERRVPGRDRTLLAYGYTVYGPSISLCK